MKLTLNIFGVVYDVDVNATDIHNLKVLDSDNKYLVVRLVDWLSDAVIHYYNLSNLHYDVTCDSIHISIAV